MPAINIRNIRDAVYHKIKQESKKSGLSMNKVINHALEDTFLKSGKESKYHDLDDFFGSWSEEEYKSITP